MSGFEIFNDAGASVINSDQRHTVFADIKTYELTRLADYEGNTPFGNLNQLRSPLYDYDFRKPDYLYWLQFTTPAWCFPGAELYQPGTFRVIRTTRNYNPQSGYLDVFDSGGNLIWSAQSAAQMPRIMGFADIDSNYPLNGNVASFYPGFNPFFLLNSCPGSATIPDEGTSGFNGVIIRWTGDRLDVSWIRRNQADYSTVFAGRGNLRILYGKFLGHN